MITFWLVLAVGAVVLWLLSRYQPSGPADVQLGNELTKALAIGVVFFALIVYIGVAVWRHVRWTP